MCVLRACHGMMICVQTNHHDEFDKLWAFAKNHMLHTSGQWQGNFAWQCGTDGSVKDQNCAPDGDVLHDVAALCRQQMGQRRQIQLYGRRPFVLKNMIRAATVLCSTNSIKVVTFQPYNCSDYSDPSYDLPAFVDLFLTLVHHQQQFLEGCGCSDPKPSEGIEQQLSSSGLYTDYNNFDGTP